MPSQTGKPRFNGHVNPFWPLDQCDRIAAIVPNAQSRISMSELPSDHQEYHVLMTQCGQTRAFALDAATYSIGRDDSNAISLDHDSISRQHALLLRMPIPQDKRYCYRIIDGSSMGKPSTNGLYINGKRCKSHDLQTGDIIRLGKAVCLSYITVSMGNAEFVKYLESIQYQSIKTSLLNPTETLVGLEEGGDIALRETDLNFRSATQPDRRGVQSLASSHTRPSWFNHLKLPQFKPKVYRLGILVLGVIGLAIAATQLWSPIDRSPVPGIVAPTPKVVQ